MERAVDATSRHQLIIKNGLYRPTEQRPANPVDAIELQIRSLQEQITRIQDACEHDYRYISESFAAESLVAGTYLLDSIQCGKVSCLKCNHVLVRRFRACPVCFGTLVSEGWSESFKRYYGYREPRTTAEIYCCDHCNFRAVTDFFDG